MSAFRCSLTFLLKSNLGDHTSRFCSTDSAALPWAQSHANLSQQAFTSGRRSRHTCRSSKTQRADGTRRQKFLTVSGFLDPKGGNETMGREKLRRRGTGSHPIKADPEIYGTRNVNCFPM